MFAASRQPELGDRRQNPWLEPLAPADTDVDAIGGPHDDTSDRASVRAVGIEEPVEVNDRGLGTGRHLADDLVVLIDA